MSRINIAGLNIEYELLGEVGAPAIALTPGGRASKDAPGVRELGLALAAAGKRVLIWDRPNCGMSDVSFEADTEGQLASGALRGLVRALDLGPTALAAGSGGARVALEAAVTEPELFSHLALWWVAGGDFSLQHLAYSYCCEPAMTVNVVGMQGLARCPSWAEQMARNPAARDRLLAQDPAQFVAIMRKWMAAYRTSDASPIAGVSAPALAWIAMPVLILRNSPSDLSHPAEVTDRLHRLIPHSQLVDPPWPEDGWNQIWGALIEGGEAQLFAGWPALADTLLAFTSDRMQPSSTRNVEQWP